MKATENSVGAAFENRLGHLIKRAEQALILGKNQALSPTGLTVPQYSALLVLSAASAASGLTGAELARRCLVTPQTMATVLANLKAKGLVERERSEVHSQVLIASLTVGGRRALRKADALALELEGRLSSNYTEAELEQLQKLLERAIEALLRDRAADSRPGPR